MSGPARAEARVQRLLVMLPWLMERGEVPLDEVAARFGISTDQVTKDLELVAMCGLPPYVDEMIDVFIDEGMVFVGVPRLFTRPLRLTTPEAFSVLAAGRVALALPGSDPEGPLARALSKLARVTAAVFEPAGRHDAVVPSSSTGTDDSAGTDPTGADSAGAGSAGTDATGADDSIGVVIDIARPLLLDVLTEAVAAGEELEVEYYSASSDALGRRRIVPRHVYVASGAWYVYADDDTSGERRIFRADRIESAQPTGRIVTVEDVEPPGNFAADAAVPRVRLAVAPSSTWMLDRVPIDGTPEPADGIEAPSGWNIFVLPVASERWISDLIVRLGPDGRLVDDGPAKEAARRHAADLLRVHRAAEPGASASAP